MSELQLLPFWRDQSAMFALAGLIVSTVVAILSATEKERHRALFVIFAVIGFLVGGAAVRKQHELTLKAMMERDLADKTLDRIRITGENTNVTVDDLARLNALSDGRFHIRLMVNPDEAIPCETARALNSKYSLAHGKDVRVVKRASRVVTGDSRKDQPVCLLFGADLPIAAADIYQRFANANAMSNGPAVIELERPKDDTPIDCSK